MSETATKANDELNEEERTITFDDFETVIAFEVKRGKNRLVLRLEPEPYLFSM